MGATRPQKPATYEFEAEHLIRALFDADSDEAAILELAAMNKVELHASGTVWNTFLVDDEYHERCRWEHFVQRC